MNNEYFGIELDVKAQIEPKTGSKNILILKKIITWCLTILIFLIPVWFLPFTNEALNLNKQVLMVGVLTIALIAWLGELLIKEKIGWFRGLIAFAFFFFVVIYALSTIFSWRPYNSLMGFDSHLNRSLINIIYFFIFFILLVNYKNENKEERNTQILKFLTIFFVSSTLSGIIGFLQVAGKSIFPWAFAKSNSFNTIGTHIGLGIFLTALLPATLSLLFFLKTGKEKQKRIITIGLRVLFAALTILTLIMLFVFNARILWTIAAIGMILLVGFWLTKRHSLPAQSLPAGRQGLAWLAIPVVILAFCLIFLLFKPGNLFKVNLPIELSLSQSSGWNIVKEVIKRSPVLGTGPETFVYNYSLYKPQAVNQTIFWNIRFVHAPSEILSLLSEIGILGVLALLVLLGLFLAKIIKRFIGNSPDSNQLIEIKIGLFSSWLALAICWFLYPQNLVLSFVFWLLFTFLTILFIEEKDIKLINLKTSGKIALATSFGFIVLTIVIIGILYMEGSRFIAEINYASGLKSVDEEKLDTGINKVIQATIANPYEDKFYGSLAQLFVAQINQNLNNADLSSEDRTTKVQLDTSNAINSAVRATTLNAKNVSNWIIRGSIYRNLMALLDGAGDWAIKSYEEAARLEPSNPFIQLEIARTYANEAELLAAQTQKDAQAEKRRIEYLNQAMKAYDKTIELKNDYATAHFELALVFDGLGKTKEAIVKMEDNEKFNPEDTGVTFQLGVLYYKDSQFEKAKLEFLRTVNFDPNYSNARYFLGLLLDKEGDKEGAIEQFENIEKLNPDNQLVKQILANLKAGKPALGSPTEIPEQPTQTPIEEEQSK